MFHKTLALLALVMTASQPLLAAETFDVRELAWLEGTWRGTANGIESEEHWTSVAGGALLGLHRDIKAGRMSSFEFFRVQTTPEGTFYFASPQGKAPTPFKLVALKARHATFENKSHDFPQRILYWLDGADVLHARIEGPIDGKTASEEWAWTRARP